MEKTTKLKNNVELLLNIKLRNYIQYNKLALTTIYVMHHI